MTNIYNFYLLIWKEANEAEEEEKEGRKGGRKKTRKDCRRPDLKAHTPNPCLFTQKHGTEIIT